MRFINKWSYSCAKGLASVLEESHQKKAEYYFGFQVAIGSIVKTTLLVAVSTILGVLIPTLIVSISFALLRKVAGGYHMDTYGKCLLVSIGFFVAAALIAKHTYLYWSITWLVILITLTFTIGLYILKKYAPKDTPNRLITDPEEKNRFKKLSIVYICVWLIVVTVLTVLGMKMYTLVLCFGVLQEIFAITPTGHKFFDIIKYGLAPHR
ncbi:accessory gene regulator B family protein [Clostridium sp. BNL1100]|uniref:accessory gene regulator ArgB-like protein n=1 Tax=Clostridium sp. BNL1100 TaxID=755731 RepID=UPI00024A71C6|nr:accessory gene regulator B family protein [Clostridium sp. BNL1100]AEY67214.1 protein possibly involved in post-translational modification of quorum-sensing peptides [Clostridium sp. BNL1100]